MTNSPTTISKLKFWLLVELAGIGYHEQPTLYKKVFGERRHEEVTFHGRDRRKNSIH